MSDDRDDEDGESPHAREKFDWATAGAAVEVTPPGDDQEDEKRLPFGRRTPRFSLN